MKPILGIFAVATGTLFLTGCNDQDRQSGNAIFRALGVTDSVGDLQAQSSAPAVVAYSEPEVVKQPEPEPVVTPPPCEPYVWRWMRYDCEGNLLGPVE